MACGSCGKARRGTAAVRGKRRDEKGDAIDTAIQGGYTTDHPAAANSRLGTYIEQLRTRRGR